MQWIISITTALLVFIVGRFLVKVITRLVSHAMRVGKMDELLVNFLSSIIQWALMLFVIIAALEQLGINTTSLVALLGAAGIAIGLALKDSLQNFSSGVMLIIFRPFKNGDLIEAAGVTGVVEHIGIFTTNLKTGDNKEVIVPNGQVYGSTITNYSAKPTRRIDLVFAISYDSDFRKAKDILSGILAKDTRVLRDPAPTVAVGELGEKSVNLLVRPWVKSGDYWDVCWNINEQVRAEFEAAGIKSPAPQMNFHLHPAEQQ
ncbi:MAG TPA: mechanosensitive ion channel domain-containing protein [Candidatus Kapabacteria bacterium]|nr:mechanosensitive ion channel domain-containing protein [Candidatus Kapabacteria bacterium]